MLENTLKQFNEKISENILKLLINKNAVCLLFAESNVIEKRFGKR